ncbi:MAG TPA: SIMPL domain-containing protein [Acidothermaceae bacterium]|nr:SIMPL domain-containing protein [Acidothermaceae bacterium]
MTEQTALMLSVRGEAALTVTATVDIQIAVRDFDLLEVLGAHLSTHEDLHIHGVSWRVDADNSGWANVRAAAIHAAIDKGRDYAAALGVSLVDVLHVADAGLLDGNPGQVGT